MFSKPMTAFALTLTTLSWTAVAQVAGNAAAVKACDGFPAGAMKCLSDVSYTICQSGIVHGSEQEYFVAAGTHCEQGIPGQKKDVANVVGVATATRIFQQASYGAPQSSVAVVSSVSSVPLTTAPATTPPATTVANTKAPLGLSGTLNDAQINSLFLTTAATSRPQPTYLENFTTLHRK